MRSNGAKLREARFSLDAKKHFLTVCVQEWENRAAHQQNGTSVAHLKATSMWKEGRSPKWVKDPAKLGTEPHGVVTDLQVATTTQALDDVNVMGTGKMGVGIYFRKGCGEFLNHGMLAVGYGITKEDGKIRKYWILKNSWAKTWGKKGYMWLAKERHNHCGVATAASYPTL
ncbi:hypothetical protein EYD10_16638 [Varanus komodoensis]|nr:hypothetical protein EYD10_16638 [Varanus komodoensis]